MFTRRAVVSGALAAAFVCPRPVFSQSYPSSPVRIILPFGAGGVADVTTRLAAEHLGTKLGHRFVIENQPGAGGIVAARSVTSAPADGYTLGLVTNGTAISVPLFKSLPFDPVEDFAMISTLGFFNLVFVSNARSEFRTLQDFIKAARERPGKLNVGTVTVGSTQNLGAELLKSTAELDFQLVVYRNTPELVVGLVRNDVQMAVEFPAAISGALQDKQLRPLATSGPGRSRVMPQVPTVQESGVPGYEVTSWNGLFAPRGTPANVIQTINGAMNEILARPDVQKRYLELGVEAKASTPAELKARLVADIAKWRKVIERAEIPQQ